MTRRLIPALALLFLLCTGCDKAELTAYGYTQALAIDSSKNGGFELTTLFYNPSGGGEQNGPKGSKPGIIIKTEANSLFKAVRDIPLVFGRKAKWDHMRIILVSEEVARKHNIADRLDYFFRDHEPRTTVLISLTKGRAGSYLSAKPFIENTIGQQLKRTQEMGVGYSAKTIRIRLLDLAIQLKSETGVAVIPYVYRTSDEKELTVSGSALLKDGKLADGILTSKQTQSLVMLLNKYKSGVIEIPCGGTRNKNDAAGYMETVEVVFLKTSIKPIIHDKELTLRFNANLKGSVGSLQCSTLKTVEDTQKLQARIEQKIRGDLEAFIAYLQQRRLDALGIGDRVYRGNPKLWKKLKPEWGQIFAEARVEVNVRADIVNTGMTVGKPFSKR